MSQDPKASLSDFWKPLFSSNAKDYAIRCCKMKEGKKKKHREFGVIAFGRRRYVLGQAPFHDCIFGTGSISVAGELIDCLIFIERSQGV